MKTTIKTYIVGICMGIADLIPGVSGGTIAFIAGIYETLLTSIHRIDKTFFGYLLSGSITHARKHIQGSFLFTLILGIGTAIAIGASSLERLLDSNPIEIFSLFSGLIIASILWFLYKHLSIANFMYAVAGFALGVLLTSVLQFTLPTTLVGYFIGGVLGSSAMILPGISGSYILLIVGMYEPVLSLISNITQGDMSTLPSLIALGGGVITGLIILGRILKRAYTQYPSQLIVAMAGLMAGALPSILPPVDLVTASSITIATVVGIGVLGGVLFAGLSWIGKNTSKHESV